jgi:hypothetical protein
MVCNVTIELPRCWTQRNHACMCASTLEGLLASECTRGQECNTRSSHRPIVLTCESSSCDRRAIPEAPAAAIDPSACASAASVERMSTDVPRPLGGTTTTVSVFENVIVAPDATIAGTDWP